MSFNDHTFCSGLFLFIQQQALVHENDRLLLAVSGGLDSMVLLHFFQRFQSKYGIELAVAHFEHQLRPASAADREWVADFCRTAGLACLTGRANVPAIHAASPQSSLEAVARDERYRWLHQTAAAGGYSQIVTGHSASDQAELLLMRLLRGSVQGLAGMRPRQVLQAPVAVIRPLLATPRGDISLYGQAHQLPYREDPSNQDLTFFRNRIRHEAMPFFRQENPAFESHVTLLCGLLADENDYLEAQAHRHLAQALVCQNQGQLELELGALKGLQPALQRRVICLALAAWRGEWKVYTARHVEAIRALLYAGQGKRQHLPDGLQVRRTPARTLLFEQRS